MRLLGAVLAGGLSSRFGSDKALAQTAGGMLIERAVAALQAQCDAVCTVGRAFASFPMVEDWPLPGMGPLGGVAGALRHAGRFGFDEVLTTAVDIPDLPLDVADRLTPAPAFIADQPVVGRWRAADLPILTDLLMREESKAMRRFADLCGARAIALDQPPRNINTPADLQAFVTGETLISRP